MLPISTEVVYVVALEIMLIEIMPARTGQGRGVEFLRR
jgi:hypothetical protein